MNPYLSKTVSLFNDRLSPYHRNNHDVYKATCNRTCNQCVPANKRTYLHRDSRNTNYIKVHPFPYIVISFSPVALRRSKRQNLITETT